MMVRIRMFAEAHSTGLFEDGGAPVRRASTSLSEETWRDLQQWVDDYDFIVPLPVEERAGLRSEIDELDRRGLALLERIRAEWPHDLETGEEIFFQYYSEGLMRTLGKIASADVAFAPVGEARVGGFRLVDGIPVQPRNPFSPSSLPPPAAVLVEPLAPGGVLLTRLAADGQPVGDTLHEDVEAARDKARSEYGRRVGAWAPVPGAPEDRVSYVVERIGASRAGDGGDSHGSSAE